MTEPVNRISEAKKTNRENTQGGIFKSDRRKQKIEHTEDDNVDISEEARDKASGKKRKNILEYIQG